MNKGFFGNSPKFWIGQVPPFQTTNKTDHIIKIKMKYKSNTVNTLFIGDSKSDVEVAFENNLNIILKKHKYNGELFEKFNKLKFFKNFNDINLK